MTAPKSQGSDTCVLAYKGQLDRKKDGIIGMN